MEEEFHITPLPEMICYFFEKLEETQTLVTFDKPIQKVSANRRTHQVKLCCWCNNPGIYVYPGNIAIKACWEHINLSPTFKQEMFLLEDIKCKEILKFDKVPSHVECCDIKRYYHLDDVNKTPMYCVTHPYSTPRRFKKGMLGKYEKCKIKDFLKKHGITLKTKY